MKHRGLKFLSLLLTLVMLVGLLPGMTAYADDKYTLTVKYGSKTILTDSNYTLTAAKTIQGKDLNPNLGSFDTVNPTGIVFYAEPLQDKKSISFKVNSDGIGTITCSYTVGAAIQIKQLDVTCVKNVPVTGVSIDPGSFQTLTVGELVTVKAEVYPDNATNKNVIWSVSGTCATLYADQACTTPVSSPTSLLTVYAKATAVGGGAVIVNSSQEGITPATFNFEVKAAGFTVTYQPGAGSLKDGITPPDGYTVENGNIVKTGVDGTYTIEGIESCFNAPEGQVFDKWTDGAGNPHKAGESIELTGDLTLTAQWKEEKKPDGGEKKTSGGGSGFDLVFNIPGADNSWEYVGGGYAPQQAYRVSLAPMQGGSAALGLTTGDSGTQMNVYPSTTVYVFPNAEQGYVLDKIVWSLIDGSASYDITEAKTFVMPAMDVVVYVTFKPVG